MDDDLGEFIRHLECFMITVESGREAQAYEAKWSTAHQVPYIYGTIQNLAPRAPMTLEEIEAAEACPAEED